MSCRKPQNVVCHKFCPHTKYLKACKYYFKNKSIASLRVEYLFATLHAKVSVEYSKKFLLRLRLRLQKSQKSFSASSRYGYYWEDAGENLRTLRQHSGANFSRVLTPQTYKTLFLNPYFNKT